MSARSGIITSILGKHKGRSMSDHSPIPVDAEDLDFRFRVGTSVLIEFAVGHTPADVLRELVQNEYDAGGTELAIEFGLRSLFLLGDRIHVISGGWRTVLDRTEGALASPLPHPDSHG
jgi:hypothetical protein